MSTDWIANYYVNNNGLHDKININNRVSTMNRPDFIVLLGSKE
jgi:hypothetical protein